MYRKIDPPLRMTANEASERFPDEFMIMQMDSRTSKTGVVLYVGNDGDELFRFALKQDCPTVLDIIDGLNHTGFIGGIEFGIGA